MPILQLEVESMLLTLNFYVSLHPLAYKTMFKILLLVALVVTCSAKLHQPFAMLHKVSPTLIFGFPGFRTPHHDWHRVTIFLAFPLYTLYRPT